MNRHFSGTTCYLRIFSDESIQRQGQPLHEFLLDEAMRQKMAGCTIIKGIESFGHDKILHTQVSAECVDQRPVRIEIVDDEERIKIFLDEISINLEGALATTESVYVHLIKKEKHLESSEPNQAQPAKGESMKKLGSTGEHRLLRIFLGEADRIGHEAAHLQIVKWSKEMGLAGCSVFRGSAGFGASNVVHEDHIFRLSSDLPILIEIVDTAEHIAKFLDHISPYLGKGLVVESSVKVK